MIAGALEGSIMKARLSPGPVSAKSIAKLGHGSCETLHGRAHYSRTDLAPAGSGNSYVHDGKNARVDHLEYINARRRSAEF